jgi:hypothetical protein
MSTTRILEKLNQFLFTPLTKLVSIRRRAELAYFHQRLDEFAANVDNRFAAMRQEFYAELKALQMRVEEAEKRNKVLALRLQALERELRKLPSIHPDGSSRDDKIGLA